MAIRKNGHFLAGLIAFITLITPGILTAQQPFPPAYNGTFSYNSYLMWSPQRPFYSPGPIVSGSLSTRDVIYNAQYMDGAGRTIQNVVRQGAQATGQSNADLVNPLIYDLSDNPAVQYLPFAANSTGGNTSLTDGGFKLNPFQQDSSFNTGLFSGQGETYFYSHAKTDSSPLYRTTEIFAPGNTWAGSESNSNPAQHRSVRTHYWMNTTLDSVAIWTVTDPAIVGQFGTYTTNSFYAPGTLYKTVTIDEDGNEAVTFKDLYNHVVLIKKQVLSNVADTGSGSGYTGWLSCYYIYDAVSNLRCVIQPMAVQLLLANNWNLNAQNGTILSEFCFRYEYDYRHRIIVRQMPGSGTTYFVYDGKDRQVMSQDSLMRANNKWLVTLYDNLDRPFEKGILLNTYTNRSFAVHLDSADNSINYPFATDPSSAYYTLMEVTHYDNYANLPAGLTASLLNTYSNYIVPDTNSAPYYAQQILASTNVLGLPTWTQKRVLGTSGFISSVTIYDNRNRVIQTQTLNQTSGLDVRTYQYDWKGRTIRNHLRHQVIGPQGTRSFDLANMFNFDNLGRLSSTANNINGAGWKTVDSLIYNAVGQVVKTVLDPTYNGGTGIESLNDEYNIRGWLLGMNRPFLRGQANNYFGFDLGFDKDGVMPYVNKQYNGNLAGMSWQSAGDNVLRKYDFGYDASNRILKAAFADSKSFDFSVQMGDGVNPFSAYDANGNILKMSQKGLKAGSSATIDSLTYTYSPTSNKLSQIVDAQNDPNSTLGDFHYSTSGKMATDYSYDGDGQLKTDNNKSISAIAYNYLNLPDTIAFKGKGTICFTYDAAGNKLTKTTIDSLGQKVRTTVTNYIGEFTYQSKTTVPADTCNPDYSDSLLYVIQPAGRIRKTDSSGYAYDYFIKDHLGNIRMVLTDQPDTIRLPPATLEPATVTTEEKFYTINTGQIVDTSLVNGSESYPQFQSKLYRINGSTDPGTTGLGMVLKVMSGDKISLSVQSIYTLNSPLTSPPVTAPLTDLLSSFLGSRLLIGEGLNASTIDGFSPGTIASAFQSQQSQTSSRPQAYLNYMLFDDQFHFISGDMDPVGTASSNAPVYKLHDKFITSPVPVTKNGYIYIFVSNQSNQNVYFDNLLVTKVAGPLLEETHYYPFGLVMAGISDKTIRKSYTANKFGYNGKELQDREYSDGSGLDWADYGARMYDVQIGRWHTLDPLFEKDYSVNGYSYVGNNPVIVTDLNGMEGTSTHTDSAGNVLAVYNDGDLGVYEHDGLTTKQQIDALYSTTNTSAGGDLMGQTLLWNSFQNDAGQAVGKIDFGSYDGLTWMYKASQTLKGLGVSNELTRLLYAINGGGGDQFDYKTLGYKGGSETLENYKYRGSQLSDGVYVSARDIGNFFAGYVAAMTGEPEDDFLKTAGAFNHYQNNKFLLGLEKIFPIYGMTSQKYPLYGEDFRSNFFQRLGYKDILTSQQLQNLGSNLWLDQN